MFNFFSRLLVVKSKNMTDPNNISTSISVHPYVARSYIKASNNYKMHEIINIINSIKNLDLISKVSKACSIPLVVSGGLGELGHLKKLLG